MLGSTTPPPIPPAHQAGTTLPALLRRLDVAALDPAVPAPVAVEALLSHAVDAHSSAGGQSGLVAATQGVMRSNVMAAVEVLKVFWRVAGGEAGAAPHLAPDKAARYRSALSKQHRACVC